MMQNIRLNKECSFAKLSQSRCHGNKVAESFGENIPTVLCKRQIYNIMLLEGSLHDLKVNIWCVGSK
jgi:hypothetical protein